MLADCVDGRGETSDTSPEPPAPNPDLEYPWGQRWTVAGTLKDERFASLQQRDAETTTWQDPLDPTLFRTYT